jgi:acyl dehydratase
MTLGDRAEVTRTYTREMAAVFAGLAGCEARSFAHVPEPLVAALFSYLLGVKLPGAGTNYLKQDLGFTGVADFGEPLTASVEVTRIRPEKHLVDLETVCRGADGRRICIGRALVLVKDVVEVG